MSPWEGTDDWDAGKWENYFSGPDEPVESSTDRESTTRPIGSTTIDQTLDKESAVRMLLDTGMRVGAKSRWELRKAIDKYSKDPVRDARAVASNDHKARRWLNRLREHWLAEHSR